MIAIKEQNHNAATDEKTKVEDQQREEAAKRLEQGIEWHPKLFRKVRGGPGESEEGEGDLDWILNAEMFENPPLTPILLSLHHHQTLTPSSDGPTPEIKSQQILAVAPILQGQSSPKPPPPAPPPSDLQRPHPPHPQPTGDLINFGQNDMVAKVPQKQQQQQLPPPQPMPDAGRPLIRTDTETSEPEEFVDANA